MPGGSRGLCLAAASLLALAATVLTGCSGTEGTGDGAVGQRSGRGTYKIGEPYQINGVWYTPREDFYYDETGIASWYGPGFHARRTANGETFDQDTLTAAHPTLQMPTLVRVTNLENGRSAVLRVNDRGPFVNGRILDVSRRSAELLGFRQQGTARVRVQVLTDESLQLAEASGRSGPVGPQFAAAAPPVTVTQASLVSAAPRAPAVEPVVLPAPQPVAASAVVAAAAPVVIQQPVQPTGIFVQAGAFSVYDNASRLRTRLSAIAPTEISTTSVNGVDLYRVRLGPLPSVDAADRVLAEIIRAGHTGARIVVD